MRTEYRVRMRDPRGRRSFTLVNATSPEAARAIALAHHGRGDRPKVVTADEPTGRTFP